MNKITLVGRAHSLTFHDGIARWWITVQHVHLKDTYDFALSANLPRVLEVFKQMTNGQLIGVICTVLPKRERKHGAPMWVQRLELLGKAQEVAA